MTFKQFSFDPRIEAGVKAAGFTTPTPIQAQAIPVVMEGQDVLGLAQTGTGKTAAFMLPILNRLTQGPLRRVRVLVVAPTRELAEQIHQATLDLSKHTKIRSVAIYGGVGKGPQVDAIRRGTEIVVACPGRLLDLVGERRIDLSKVEVLVLDESDRMCDMGFLPDIRRIVNLLPRQRQTLFFSATMPDDIRTLADTILDDPVTVQIGIIAPAKTVSHAFYPVPDDRKKRLLFSILEETATGRVLVFTRTKWRARGIAKDLEKRRYRAVALQGNMSQNKRQKAIDGFRDGKYDILVATDIAARGIDVSDISHVINFDIPDTVDAYTHRIGRTGRAKQSGEAFTLAVPDDAALVYEIEKVLETRIERRSLSDFDYGDFIPENQFKQKPKPQSRAKNPNRHRKNSRSKSRSSHKRHKGQKNTSNASRKPQQGKQYSRQR